MNSELRNALVTAVVLILAVGWLRLMDTLAHRGLLPQTLSRKVIHTGTGPLFILCWPLFSETTSARWWAALIPLAIALQFAAVGLGWIEDKAAVAAMTRHGSPREILRGPLYYGLSFVVCTLVFWRSSPVGMLALMILCGGDGLADIVGRRWGKHKLPFSPHKSWVGSGAMFAGSFIFSLGMLWWFDALGYFSFPLTAAALLKVGAIAFVATLVEALPYPDIDNLTLTATGIGLGLILT
ncbi:MAG: diacylglycerol/polyprenol kinase family protein [Elainellaceae cyanobacterium]